jgi:hypothetical protein
MYTIYNLGQYLVLYPQLLLALLKAMFILKVPSVSEEVLSMVICIQLVVPVL